MRRIADFFLKTLCTVLVYGRSKAKGNTNKKIRFPACYSVRLKVFFAKVQILYAHGSIHIYYYSCFTIFLRREREKSK